MVFGTDEHPEVATSLHELAGVLKAQGDLPGARAKLERAVDHLRSSAMDDRDTLVRLRVILYNLAGYYSQAGRWDDAVAAFEEVVAMDEQTRSRGSRIGP